MKHDSTRRRRAAAGLACITIGSVAVVAGLAAPASAHEGKEPYPIPDTNSLSCAELADRLSIDADWTESKIESGDLPGEGESQTYVISDRGTPDDDSDDATVTIDMIMELKNFNWSSNVGIDAIYVKGGSEGSYFYGYQPDVSHEGEVVGPGEEATEDIDLGTPPWKVEGKNQISHVTFCWDDEQGPTTSSSSSSTSSTTSTSMPTPTTECPGAPVDLQEGETGGMPDDETTPSSEPEPTTSSSEPETPDECETTTTTPPTTAPSTTVSIEPDVSTTVLDSGPTTTLPITPQSNSLPDTGSNTTPLILGGLVLLAIGGGLVAGNKWLRKA